MRDWLRISTVLGLLLLYAVVATAKSNPLTGSTDAAGAQPKAVIPHTQSPEAESNVASDVDQDDDYSFTVAFNLGNAGTDGALSAEMLRAADPDLALSTIRILLNRRI